MSGAPDSRIVEACQTEGRTLVPLDLDFVELARNSLILANGVVVFRLGRQDKAKILKATKQLIGLLKAKAPQQQIWVIEENAARIRDING